MNQALLRFAALESAQVIPVVGCNAHLSLGRYLHGLGTVPAYRMLGGLLSSSLITKPSPKHSKSTYVHNEVWVHLNSSLCNSIKGNRSTYIAQHNKWDLADFFVLLTTYRDFENKTDNEKVEVRAVINSTRYASLKTTKSFYQFIFALWKLQTKKPLYFKCTEDYLLDSLPGAEFLKRIYCLNYSMQASKWLYDYKMDNFSESGVAHEFDLYMDEIKPEDIEFVQKMNVIRYDKAYLSKCLPATTCIRRASDSAPITWIIAHLDYEIGAVFTVDGYKSRNLGKYAFQDVINKTISEFTKKVSLLYDGPPPDHDYKLHMVTEMSNHSARRMIEPFGLRPVANVSWAICTFDPQEYPNSINLTF
ncbi:hypothetical protein IWW36_003781 [Coemansia brasiliensis]|uniref:Uncharacterized protein n=1 Tax=Coemansia brasiliensis TaxID=2650707 RepID=A0A9W8LYM4_9FUNG|nr:hypothetical protein IWW36_003781 [Coemansia brasiliensis]